MPTLTACPAHVEQLCPCNPSKWQGNWEVANWGQIRTVLPPMQQCLNDMKIRQLRSRIRAGLLGAELLIPCTRFRNSSTTTPTEKTRKCSQFCDPFIVYLNKDNAVFKINSAKTWGKQFDLPAHLYLYSPSHFTSITLSPSHDKSNRMKERIRKLSTAVKKTLYELTSHINFSSHTFVHHFYTVCKEKLRENNWVSSLSTSSK